jgi:hypothetical protein
VQVPECAERVGELLFPVIGAGAGADGLLDRGVLPGAPDDCRDRGGAVLAAVVPAPDGC